MNDTSPTSGYKKQAALKAVEYIRDGMVVGLGTGSTASYAIEALGEMVKQGLRITGIPTSSHCADLASRLGIKLSDLNANTIVDITIDGADEVEHDSLNLIKGLGGALLREKITAVASKRVIVIVDDSKITSQLGSKAPVPIEVAAFGWNTTAQRLDKLVREQSSNPALSTLVSGKLMLEDTVSTTHVVLRRTQDGQPFVTDGGNYILDCHFGTIANAPHLESLLSNVVGVVETGLFIDIASEVIVASSVEISILSRHLK